MKRIARTDPINRTLLLSLKHEGKGGGHILPLDSDDVEAYQKSPLSTVLTRNEDPSEMASNFMGPGPWTFHHDLQLPTSCNILHFTNKNRRGNIVITHMLKCVIRIERGDDKHLDPKTGKRKLFDIVIQTPVQILSVSFLPYTPCCCVIIKPPSLGSVAATPIGFPSHRTRSRARIGYTTSNNAPASPGKIVPVICYRA